MIFAKNENNAKKKTLSIAFVCITDLFSDKIFSKFKKFFFNIKFNARNCVQINL